MRKLVLLTTFLLFLFSAKPTTTQRIEDKQIFGRVYDAATDEVIPGASIIISGTSVGTVTDNAGGYILTAPVGSTIVCSFIGYGTQQQVVGEKLFYDFHLDPEEE